jgi:hypothetical protein
MLANPSLLKPPQDAASFGQSFPHQLLDDDQLRSPQQLGMFAEPSQQSLG